MKDTIFVTLFDEAEKTTSNLIYTSINGGIIKAGVYNQELNTYSLLALVEKNWDLGSLTANDNQANPVPLIWKNK